MTHTVWLTFLVNRGCKEGGNNIRKARMRVTISQSRDNCSVARHQCPSVKTKGARLPLPYQSSAFLSTSLDWHIFWTFSSFMTCFKYFLKSSKTNFSFEFVENLFSKTVSMKIDLKGKAWILLRKKNEISKNQRHENRNV